MLFFIAERKRVKSEESTPSESNRSSLVNQSNSGSSQTSGSTNQSKESSNNNNAKDSTTADGLSSCDVLNKSKSQTMESKSALSVGRSPLQISTQCQYGSSSYLQGGSPSLGAEQVYYPHHTHSGNMNPGLLQPVTTAAGLLQPVGSGLNLHRVSPQMPACQLSGQNTACALAGAGNSVSSSSHGYGFPPQAHTSLPSCTYMQANQAYPSHLAPNMSVMNIANSAHFAGHM